MEMRALWHYDHVDNTHTQAALDAVKTELGDPSTWGAPVEMRDSLALCALNSAYTLRSTSRSVVNALGRYCEHRRAQGQDPKTDSGPQLLQCMDEAGGPEQFAHNVLQHDGKLPGTHRLRAEGVYEALTKLAALNVTTTEELRASATSEPARLAWTSAQGLGPQSWSYLLMNAGVTTETKPDVMVRRFLTRAVGQPVTANEATELVNEVAAALNVEVRSLDRAIWLHESPSDVR